MQLLRYNDKKPVSIEAGAIPRHLAFSQDGKRLLGATSQLIDRDLVFGHGPALATNFPWIGVWEFAKGELTELPIDERQRRGGRVAAFSRDGKKILAANNIGPLITRPYLWRDDNGWKVEREFSSVKGFALACGENANGEWLLLTASTTKGSFGCELPLKLYNLSNDEEVSYDESSRIKNSEYHESNRRKSFFGAALSDDLKSVHWIVRSTSNTTSSSSWFSAPVVANELNRVPESRIDLSGLDQHYLPARPFLGTSQWHSTMVPMSQDCMTISQPGPATGRNLVVVKRENRTDLAFAATDGTAFFDRECKRLFVLTPERGLEILDPNSSTPTRVLLTIPVNGMREETIADQSRRHLLTFALSPSGDQIAIGINHNLTFLDVSGGRPSPTDDSTSTLPGPM